MIHDELRKDGKRDRDYDDDTDHVGRDRCVCRDYDGENVLGDAENDTDDEELEEPLESLNVHTTAYAPELRDSLAFPDASLGGVGVEQFVSDSLERRIRSSSKRQLM